MIPNLRHQWKLLSSQNSGCCSPDLPGGLSISLAASDEFSEERNQPLHSFRNPQIRGVLVLQCRSGVFYITQDSTCCVHGVLQEHRRFVSALKG